MNIRNIDFKGQRVLMRVDFNVPLDNRMVSDNTRIENTMPTILYLLESGAQLILMSHLGRPQKDLDEEKKVKRNKYSLAPVAEYLKNHYDITVHFSDMDIEKADKSAFPSLNNGELLLLENTRFYPGEKKGDTSLAESMASLADFYINDAFGTAHRAHASTAIVAQCFDRNHKAFGFLMEKELQNGKRLLEESESPFVAVIGGAKVSDKLALLENLIPILDKVLIGGGMAYTFIKAGGGDIGKSLLELDKMNAALEVLKKAKESQTEILLPPDSICAQEIEANCEIEIMNSGEIKDTWMGLDIGPGAIQQFCDALEGAKTILWNGPLGAFEIPEFATGSLRIAEKVAELSKKEGTYSLIGGGDSVSAVKKAGVANHISFISTGGGAMLSLLEGKALPAIKAIIED